MRLFFALELTDELRSRVVAVQQDLMHRLDNSNYRWTDPTRLHVTLSFLGDVDEDRLEELRERAQAIAKDHSPFVLRVGGLGAFPKTARPRVLWMGVSPVEGSEKEVGDVAALASDLGALGAAFGNAAPTTEAKLHVTLARSKINPSRAEGAKFKEASKGLAVLQLGELPVAKFVLFSSSLGKDAPSYKPLLRFEL